MITNEADKIVSAAARGENCPVGATCIDRALYHGLSALYGLYRVGMITKDKAASEKMLLLKQYSKDKALERAMHENARIRVSLDAYLKTVDFERCPLARIMDGREGDAERIPTGLREGADD